jgi:transposase
MIKWGKISNYKLKKILQCFCEDLTALQTAKLLSLNRNTVNRYFKIFRAKIILYQDSINKGFKGEIELDESYFGGRNKGRRGRGTAKIPVFGILKRNGRVYTQIIRNATKAEIKPIIAKLIHKESTIYTDKWKAYDGLVFDGYKHYRINHSELEYSNCKGTHINGIENFWSYAKRRLRKFNGISAKDFYLHLKETEFRYNEKDKMFEKMMLILKKF